MNRRVQATLRQMEVTADRIRMHHKHATVNPVYDAALEHLATVIIIARTWEPSRYGDDGREIGELEQLYATPAAKR